MASEPTKNKTIIPPAGASRRDFLRASAITAAATMAFPHIVSAQVRGANDKIRVASIGVGGKGGSDVDQAAAAGGEIVALCDVDENTLNEKAKKYPQAKLYRDFRKMFEEMEKGIDAVTVSTPDHVHGIAAGTAMKLGKHVYCQKPFVQTVYEARTLRGLAKEKKVASQMGNQGSAEDGLRRAVEVIQSGLIGKPLELHIWSNRPIWPQGIARPAGEDPVPNTLDWDAWIGPAAMRPFKKGVYHGFNWRGWYDFGTGALGDMACHTVNMAFRALKLGYPTAVECEATSQMFPETFPLTSRIRFEFPERDGLPPLKFWWYDGNPDSPATFRPKPELQADILDVKKEKGRLPGSGCLIVGEKGQIFSPDDYGASFLVKLKGDEKFKGSGNHEAVKAIPNTIALAPVRDPANRGKTGTDERMKLEWFEMMKTGKPAYSNFDIAAYLTEIILLGCIAMRVGVGRKMDWDGPNMKSTNIAEAAQYVKRVNRKGWDLI